VVENNQGNFILKKKGNQKESRNRRRMLEGREKEKRFRKNKSNQEKRRIESKVST